MHILELSAKTLHGYFDRDLPPILTIQPGDTVRCQTLDAGWGALLQPNLFQAIEDFEPRDRQKHFGHALTGPIAIEGAKPGMALEIRIKTIKTGSWGWSGGAKLPSQIDKRLGFPQQASGPPAVITVPQQEQATLWMLDSEKKIAINQRQQRLTLRPFLGVMGMPEDQPGIQTTFPPRFCGGNMDCKELIEGSTLYLPITVEGGLFSLGDGHALQGDGEVAGPALACPMELVELEFHLCPDMKLSMPRALTSIGWLTFGFHKDLNEAWIIAIQEMLKLMNELYGFETKEALALASLVVDLRITQAVNGLCGVHAVLPHHAIETL
jgi:acetamidase/formamidase